MNKYSDIQTQIRTYICTDILKKNSEKKCHRFQRHLAILRQFTVFPHIQGHDPLRETTITRGERIAMFMYTYTANCMNFKLVKRSRCWPRPPDPAAGMAGRRRSDSISGRPARGGSPAVSRTITPAHPCWKMQEDDGDRENFVDSLRKPQRCAASDCQLKFSLGSRKIECTNSQVERALNFKPAVILVERSYICSKCNDRFRRNYESSAMAAERARDRRARARAVAEALAAAGSPTTAPNHSTRPRRARPLDPSLAKDAASPVTAPVDITATATHSTVSVSATGDAAGTSARLHMTADAFVLRESGDGDVPRHILASILRMCAAGGSRFGRFDDSSVADLDFVIGASGWYMEPLYVARPGARMIVDYSENLMLVGPEKLLLECCRDRSAICGIIESGAVHTAWSGRPFWDAVNNTKCGVILQWLSFFDERSVYLGGDGNTLCDDYKSEAPPTEADRKQWAETISRHIGLLQ
jgi:hypothetical protein